MSAPLTIPSSSPMSTEDDVPETNPAPKTTGSFAERISFKPIFDNLIERGIHLSAADQDKFREITLDELRKHDGGSFVGSHFGASGVNILYMVFAFIQNFAASLTGMKLDNAMSLTVDAGAKALEQGKLNHLENATMNIYRRLTMQGGDLARAAELSTGLVNRPNSFAQHMDGSIPHQLMAGINLPAGTPILLNRGATATIEAPPATPSSTTNPLTQRA